MSVENNKTKASLLKKRKRLTIYLHDIYKKLCKDLDVDRVTTNYIISRLKNEGIAFVTKVLPLYSAYVLRCVEENRVIDPREISLTHFSLKGGAPCFMQGYLLRALDGCPSSLYVIRQLCEYTYKTAFQFCEAEIVNAQEKYVQTELDCENFEPNGAFLEKCRKTAELAFPELATCDLSRVFSTNRPRYGPGAFFGSEHLGGERFEVWKKLPELTERPSSQKPFAGYYKPYPGMSAKVNFSYQQDTKLLSQRYKGNGSSELGVRTCEIKFVPKDSRGPRVISKEMPEFIRGQMAFNDWFSNFLETKSRCRVLFSDQSVHRTLAKQGSKDRTWATCDMKEASDRLSYRVVKTICRNFPVVRQSAELLRSTHFTFGNGEFRRLHKWANMGSGLCFSLLAFVIYIAAVTSLRRFMPLKKAMSIVYVYGDDLIIPNSFYSHVVADLNKIGLLLNDRKSFFRGFFRESCGGDYYHGEEVTPIRLRLAGAGLETVNCYRSLSLPLTTDTGALQLERHCRELVKNGLFSLAEYYYSKLEKSLGSKLPYIHDDSPYLGRTNFGYVPRAVEVYFAPATTRKKNPDVCPYKGIARSLLIDGGIGEDWSLTPLRRKVFLRKERVVATSNLAQYGIADLDGPLKAFLRRNFGSSDYSITLSGVRNDSLERVGYMTVNYS